MADVLSEDFIQKKMFVREAYPGKKWHKKVDKMPPHQILAIYYSMLNRISGKKRKEQKEDKAYHQMTLFEFGLERR